MPAELTDQQAEVLRELEKKWDAAETTHKRYREQWDRLDALYHSRRDFLAAHASASPRDKDNVISDGRKAFGTDLLIPYAFSVVETVLPRLLSNRPRMLFTARNPESEKNVDNVRVIMDAQQHRSNYELKLQTTGRSGLIYGLGVQKVGWRHEEIQTQRLRKRILGMGYAKEAVTKVLWDDPDVDDVSIYDFLWDPYGDSMKTVEWVFHRSWRSTNYVMAKVLSGEWGECRLDVPDLEGAGGKEQYVSLHSNRWAAQGQSRDLREPVHEIWEFHDRQRVITVVNRQWPVSVVDNPAWHGGLPFHIYRPTEVLHEFCGKGEIEPMEELSYEMNQLRSDRRYNAIIKLHQAHFYEEGTLDPDEVRIGPGELIPVRGNGIPLRELLMPINVGDIPNSSYQEEAALQADIERVTGISDPVSGASTGAEQTATGVQLVQAAAGMRIQNKTRRVELELIKEEAEQWLSLNQQHITEPRDVAVQEQPTAGPDPDRRFTWRKVGPEEMAGEFDVEPDGGSTAPENLPQMRQDAQILMTLLQAPGADPRKVLTLVFEKLGIKAPESLMLPEVFVPPETLDLIAAGLEQLGIDPALAEHIVGGALQTALAQQQEGPDPHQQLGPDGPASGGPPQSEPDQPPEKLAA